MYRTGYAVAEFHFGIADAVPAPHHAAGFLHLGEPPGEHALEHIEISTIGKADDGERRHRLAAHRIDIAQRIYRGDLAEDEGVVNDGSEEVYGLHQRDIVGQ